MAIRGTQQRRNAWLQELRNRPGFFEIQLEEVSQESVTMLDPKVSKGKRWMKSAS